MTGILLLAGNYAVCIGLAAGISGRFIRCRERSTLTLMMILLAIGTAVEGAAVLMRRDWAMASLNITITVIVLALLGWDAAHRAKGA